VSERRSILDTVKVYLVQVWELVSRPFAVCRPRRGCLSVSEFAEYSITERKSILYIDNNDPIFIRYCPWCGRRLSGKPPASGNAETNGTCKE
jgi:hypothetical protein